MNQFLNMMMGIFALTMMIDFVVVVYKGFRAEDIRVPLLILVISFVGVIIINELLFIFSG
ncbi:hypothetical protein [uncultured Granulicatella sp.]|uniref:hypothetical protein n=1 Tax=uncultured Granulicatella sp. TaxID=316089 RepID=UPI0028F01440|nr:hypothetical protein [uncultured Granulicatella sp.]